MKTLPVSHSGNDHLPDETITAGGTGLLRSLGALCSVLGTRLLTIGYTCRIQRTSDDVITDARQVLDSPASDKNNAVLLQSMSDTGDVNDTFQTVDETDSGDLSDGGVRLFRGGGGHG